MSVPKPLIERFLKGDEIHTIRMPMDATREQVQDTIAQNHCDMLYIDAQHGPVTDWDIIRICSAAEQLDVPVQMRIRHWREAYLIGHYLDLGLFGIKVPEIETKAAVIEAINAFYYPPLGRRSWGGWVGYGIQDRRDRQQYAAWWNENGILGIKVESIQAVLNVRSLAQPGLTYLDFGPSDLSFDLETHPHPRLKTIQDCVEHVKRELVGIQIRIM